VSSRPLIVVVSGGRYDRLHEPIVLTSHQLTCFNRLVHHLLWKHGSDDLIIRHGAAIGTDQEIDRYIKWTRASVSDVGSIEVQQFPVLSTDGRTKISPKIRNIRMIRNTKPLPDYLIVFPGNTGTAHAVSVAMRKPSILIYKWSGSTYHGRFELLSVS